VGAVAACDVQQGQDRRLAGGEIDGLHRARGSGQRQEAIHLSGSPNEDETASFAAGAATRADERADAGSVHARKAAKVDYHEPCAPGCLAHALLEPWRRHEVQLAGDADPCCSANAGARCTAKRWLAIL
jgi:hypothetical protein